jgi:Polyketide cyclase / dehydrase and lipid transport
LATTYESRYIGVSIDRPPDEVYAFVSNPENLPKWATGLGGSIRRGGGEWVVDSPLGTVKLHFAKRNDLGVLDHDVTLESGETVHNPIRVVPNGEGSEVIFILFRRPDMSDEKICGRCRVGAEGPGHPQSIVGGRRERCRLKNSESVPAEARRGSEPARRLSSMSWRATSGRRCTGRSPARSGLTRATSRTLS